MANCCNTIIPPACTKKCEQHYDACCVIDEQALPCIFPPVETTGAGTINQYTITVADATGIEEGMLVTGGGVGEDARVETIAGLTITLSVVNEATFPGVSVGEDLVFQLVEQTQCDINKAVDEALCALNQGTTPCRTYTDATINTATYDWTEDSPVQFSAPMNCEVALRGAMTATNVPGTQTFQITTTLFTISAGSRPAVDLLIPTVVQISDPLTQSSTLHLPAMYTIASATGVVTLTLIHPNPCDPCTGDPHFDVNNDLTLTVTFANITFDTQ